MELFSGTLTDYDYNITFSFNVIMYALHGDGIRYICSGCVAMVYLFL